MFGELVYDNELKFTPEQIAAALGYWRCRKIAAVNAAARHYQQELWQASQQNELLQELHLPAWATGAKINVALRW